jgi:RNA polymerase sigma-70 factor (ECF subfamily)
VTDETEWIRLAQQGDQAAFGHLVVAYQTPVYNLTYRMLGNTVEAEDAAQEAFLRAYTHLRSYDPTRPFRSWMLAIASHYCIDRLRRQRLNWLSLEDEAAMPYEPASDCPSPETALAQQEQKVHIQRLLAALSPTDRAAITLCYWHDCSYEEIAEMLNLTVSAVKSRLHRARQALGKMLAEGAMSDAMQAG